MHMGVRPEFSAPGVQNTVKPDGCTQSFWVAAEVQKGLGGFLKQQVVHDPPVILADGVELMRQGKDTVVIGHRQKVFDPCLNPFIPCDIVAARAVAVSAGIIAFFHVAAGVADLPVGAEFFAPAVFDVVHGLVLPGMQTVGGPELFPVFAEDVTEGRTCLRFFRQLLMCF